MSKITKPELLAPASGWRLLRAAVSAGADAVYFGVGRLNMRTHAKNFTSRGLKKVVEFCHENNVKAYLTVNTIVFDDELSKQEKLLKQAKDANVDAIILWDMSLLEIAKKLNLEIHLSTQASVSNSMAAEFFRKQGVSRIILARECSLKHIRAVKKSSGIQVETFVHGAMCVSISGRCFLSQDVFGRSANRGDCIQPCRREYEIQDPLDKQKYVLGGNYILSPKDLCAMPFLDKLVNAGVSSFKIEGRNRSPEYVKVVVSAYRKAIDDLFNSSLKKKDRDLRIKEYLKELASVYNRGFSSGFYLNSPTADDFTDAYGSKATTRKHHVGNVVNFYRKVGVAEVHLTAGEIKIGDEILIIGNKTGVANEMIQSMHIKGKGVTSAQKGISVGIKLSAIVRRNDRIYLVKKVKPN